MTVSARKKYLLYFAFIDAIILVLVIGFLQRSDTPKLTANGTQYMLEINDTDSERRQGLSGRDSLSPEDAMLFVFDANAQHCFWMKDMKFGIDIVWLDEAKKVLAIEHSVHPRTYPENFCHGGKYVVEFVAGTARQLGLAEGSPFDF